MLAGVPYFTHFMALKNSKAKCLRRQERQEAMDVHDIAIQETSDHPRNDTGKVVLS
jgi:hypothetical protein